MLIWQAARQRANAIAQHVPVSRDKGLESLVFIAEQYGAKVDIHPLANDDVLGVIHKPKLSSDPTVTINSSKLISVQRFWLAHEIGHLIDREEIARDFSYTFIDYQSRRDCDPHESFADEFASQLLMPEPEFSNYLKKNEYFATSVEFCVPVSEVIGRIESLNRNPVSKNS